MLPSSLPYLELVASVYATIFVGFGILWFINPPKALSFFELPYPGIPPKSSASTSANASASARDKDKDKDKDKARDRDRDRDKENDASAPKDQISIAAAKQTMDAVSVAYGVRNVFMGAAIYAAALCGNRHTLGWIMIAAGCVALTDGAVCKFMVGKGEMNHWSYAPVLVLLGSVMLGALDWVPVESLSAWT